VTIGFFQAIGDLVVRRKPTWDKTDRAEDDNNNHVPA
jgi:hypothetical protein